MELSNILAFNLALIVALISPGPAFLIVVQTTLTSGRFAGTVTGIGLAAVAALWTTSALLGLEIVFSLFPWIYMTVKTIGALYLLYIAYKMWCSAKEAIIGDVQITQRAFRQGALVNLLNPKSVLFAAAIVAVIFPAQMTVAENGFIIANHFICEVVFYSLLAFGMSRKAVQDRYIAAKSYIDRIASAILGLLGLRLLLSR